MKPEPSTPDRSGGTDGSTVPEPAFFVKIPISADAVTADIARVRVELGHATGLAAESGWTVRFVNGMYLPADACLLCGFTAGSEEAVHAAVRLIERPYALVEIRPGAAGPLPRTP